MNTDYFEFKFYYAIQRSAAMLFEEGLCSGDLLFIAAYVELIKAELFRFHGCLDSELL